MPQGQVPLTPPALDCLEERKFDLLVLDILLPNRPEDPPSKDNALDLLYQIQEGDELIRPSNIIGITADREALEGVSEQFRRSTWTVLSCDDDNDEWITSIERCVSYIEKHRGASSSPSKSSEGDLVVQTALDSPELKAVLRLPWDWQAPRPLSESIFIRDGTFVSNGRQISVAAVCCPRMGMVSSSLVASKVIERLRPKVLAMTGICAGLPGKARMGEVILCDPVWDYQSGKRVLNEKDEVVLLPSQHQLAVDQMVRAHTGAIAEDLESLDQLCREFPGTPPGQLRIKVGPVGCGSAVIADGKTVETIKSQHRDAVGVEMEAYGLYAASQFSDEPRPTTFALKAVCDFADPDKHDEHQEFAALASAGVLRLLMERFGDRLVASRD